MGLFDLFKKKTDDKGPTGSAEKTAKNSRVASSTTIPDSEKKYYQPDSYYTKKAHEGTMFESEVITFNKRKETSLPSRNGLYVPEILMLHFCTKYPNPKNGYPGYWWFMYGIRDVGTALKSLETRKFIALNEYTGQYDLTELGKAELGENAYVPYMHKNSTYRDFTVWDLNLMLGNGDKCNYMEIINKQHAEISKAIEVRNKVSMAELKKIDPEGYDKLKAQDEQLAEIQAAEAKYVNDKNLDELIAFWEQIWSSGGLKFAGSHWTFRLPDLYIKAKKYDDALSLVYQIKKRQKTYVDKAGIYIAKIEERKAKAAAKNKE